MYFLKKLTINLEEGDDQRELLEIINTTTGNSFKAFLDKIGCESLKIGREYDVYKALVREIGASIPELKTVDMHDDEYDRPVPISYIEQDGVITAVFIGVKCNNRIGMFCVYTVYTNAKDIIGKMNECAIDYNESEDNTFYVNVEPESVFGSDIKEEDLEESLMSLDDFEHTTILQEMYNMYDSSYTDDRYSESIMEEMNEILGDIEIESDDIFFTEAMVPIFVNRKNEYLIEYKDIQRLMDTYALQGKECTEYMAMKLVCDHNDIAVDEAYILLESKEAFMMRIANIKNKMRFEKDPNKKAKLRIDLKMVMDKMSKLRDKNNIKLKQKKSPSNIKKTAAVPNSDNNDNGKDEE